MKKIVFLLLLSYCPLIFSQENYNSETYIVSLDDIKASTFVKDTTANALVIYESGNSYVDKETFDLRTEVKRKIKILKHEGFDKATIIISLYNNDKSYQKIEKITAATYNILDGSVVKTSMADKDIFKETYDENHKLVKFTLPNIKEGSVITYSYTLISPFMFNYKSWDFQADIPKMYSEYNTSIPGNWEYNIKLVGDKKLFKNESTIEKQCLTVARGGSADCAKSIYIMKDVPAFIEEDYMTSKSNYLARIEYELKTFQDFEGKKNNYAKTWETVDKELELDDNVGKQLSKSIKLEEILPLEIINETDALKKATSIYQFVQQNYTWNEEYLIFKNVSVKDLIKNRSGNVSAINILLHNLLEETGIEVKPVLLSTRDNGFATTIFPIISEFNYLIVQAKINDKSYFLDATDKYLSFGDIPFRCLNQYGRLLDFKKGSEWVDIRANSPSSILYKADLTIDDQLNITGTIDTKYTGYHALNVKKSYFSNKDSYLEKLENSAPYIEISNYEVLNENKASSDFSETYNIVYNSDSKGDNIYLNPFFKMFFTENPFKLQERTYPIDFGFKSTYLYMFILNLNDEYTVSEQPKDIILRLPNNTGLLSLTSKVLNNSVNLLMKIDFKEPIYPPEYYPYLKEFMNKVVQAQKNTIIFLKKT